MTEFVDAGRDLLLAVGSGVSEELRELAQEMGVDLAAKVGCRAELRLVGLQLNRAAGWHPFWGG